MRHRLDHHYAYRCHIPHGLLARYVNLRVAHAPEMPGTFSPPPRVSDPDMHYGTCVTHVLWCMPESLTTVSFEVVGGENVPDFSGACVTLDYTYLVRGTWECLPINSHIAHSKVRPDWFKVPLSAEHMEHVFANHTGEKPCNITAISNGPTLHLYTYKWPTIFTPEPKRRRI